MRIGTRSGKSNARYADVNFEREKRRSQCATQLNRNAAKLNNTVKLLQMQDMGKIAFTSGQPIRRIKKAAIGSLPHNSRKTVAKTRNLALQSIASWLYRVK